MTALDKGERHDLHGDGKIVLYKNIKRGKLNQVWQCSITSASSTGRIRISTKTKNLEEAKRIAQNAALKAEGRLQLGIPLSPARFHKTAIEYLSWAENEFKKKRMTKNKYLTHKRIISGQFIDYFKDAYLHAIKTKDIEKYLDQRKRSGIHKQGEAVGPATLNRDTTILNAIFKYAIREDYLQIAPTMPKSHYFQTRASFSRNEMITMQQKLSEWNAQAHVHKAPHVRDYRALLQLYALIISYSGIRPGLEMCSLKWNNIEYLSSKGQSYVKLVVITSKNKKGEQHSRNVIAMPQLKKHIETFKKDYPHLYAFEAHIFVHPITSQLAAKFIGKPISTFKKQWENFLRWADLLHEKTEPYRARPLYSLRHYYFEQRIINSNAPLIMLAKNGGTSITVLQKWYADVVAEDGAQGLAGLISKE